MPFGLLRSRIQDEDDKVLFDEAVRCHGARAYRGAFILAWIAAAEGLLNKLTQMGHLAPDIGRFADRFRADQATGIAKDATLIEKAAAFGFLDATETKQLGSLRDLRNQYGHPTAAAPTETGARWAIEVAVETVLSKPALLLHGAVKQLVSDPSRG